MAIKPAKPVRIRLLKAHQHGSATVPAGDFMDIPAHKLAWFTVNGIADAMTPNTDKPLKTTE